MGRLLEAIWTWPWPNRLRQLADSAAKFMPLRLLLFPIFHVGVVAIATDAEGKVLLVRHTYRRDFPWGLPSGFLEHREQPQDAVQRELREEAGVRADVEELWKVYVDNRRGLLNIVFTARVLSVAQFKPSAEIEEARFFDLGSLPPLMPGQSELLLEWSGRASRG